MFATLESQAQVVLVGKVIQDRVEDVCHLGAAGLTDAAPLDLTGGTANDKNVAAAGADRSTISFNTAFKSLASPSGVHTSVITIRPFQWQRFHRRAAHAGRRQNLPPKTHQQYPRPAPGR